MMQGPFRRRGETNKMIRIGESRLEKARERRWSRPYNALDPAVLRLEEEEAPKTRRAVRLGIVAAIVFHVLLFFVVFPSYYEPWGYTPLETGALGVSSLTTDLSGFGKYILRKYRNVRGIYVLRRQNVTSKRAAKNLADFMYEFSLLDTEDRIKRKLEAKQIADTADWGNMVEHYIEAHNLSLTKLK